MIKTGLYRHYKGGIYNVFTVAEYKGNKSKIMVIYSSAKTGKFFAQDLNAFNSILETGEKRFELLDDYQRRVKAESRLKRGVKTRSYYGDLPECELKEFARLNNKLEFEIGRKPKKIDNMQHFKVETWFYQIEDNSHYINLGFTLKDYSELKRIPELLECYSGMRVNRTQEDLTKFIAQCQMLRYEMYLTFGWWDKLKIKLFKL